jgi:hypothetical protein
MEGKSMRFAHNARPWKPNGLKTLCLWLKPGVSADQRNCVT